MKLESCQQIFEKYSNFTVIRPVGAQLFHANRQDEANSGFPQFFKRA